MAKYIRLIFAYRAPVVSNGVAPFIVQARPMSLKVKRKLLSHSFHTQAAKVRDSLWHPRQSSEISSCRSFEASDGLKRFR
jgi:hypothetical protein